VNEDKLSISINVKLPKEAVNSTTKSNISFFGTYDGHGGDSVAEIMKDELHKQIFNDVNFLLDPEMSILKGFSTVEESIIDKNLAEYMKKNKIDKSGSCAFVLIALGK
jgi:serine/threonine protein phosphatase PrpC